MTRSDEAHDLDALASRLAAVVDGLEATLAQLRDAVELRAAATDSATISVEEAARLLGISLNTAYAAAERGELPTIRIGTRRLVPRARLEALLYG